MTKIDAPRDWRPVLHGLARARGFNPECRRFWFLRHGESVGNATHRIQGQMCWGLSEIGFTQAEDVPNLLRDAPIQRIVASDLERVRQTIAPLIEARDMPVEYTPGLRERAFGGYEGNEIAKDLWFATDRGVEQLEDFVERVLTAAEHHLNDDHMLIAAHGGVLHVLYGAMGAEVEPWMRANAVPIEFSRGTDGQWVTNARRPAIETTVSAVT